MSKIQEAINKIRANKDRNVRSGDAQQRKVDSRVARVVQPTIGGSADIDLGRKLIEVDRSTLRKAGFLAPEDQERAMADQYRLIKRPLVDYASGKTSNSSECANLIMVASALPGDGKTFTCINLALSMALETEKSVLMIDADVPKPNISQLFGAEKEIGLIDIVNDGSLKLEDVVMQTDVPGLSILPAGQYSELATELLASRRMERLAVDLSKRYPDTLMIFDSPPLLVTSEARVLAGHMGQIVVVVYSGHTPRHAVSEALECLDRSKSVSLMLNQADSGVGAAYFDRYAY